jgi:hypothetical protein
MSVFNQVKQDLNARSAQASDKNIKWAIRKLARQTPFGCLKMRRRKAFAMLLINQFIKYL